MAYLASIILKQLRRLTTRDGKPFEPSANLLRALLVNSAKLGSDWQSIFGDAVKGAKFDWRKACGFGQSNLARAIEVQDNRMILVYQGEVEPAEMKEAGRKFGKHVRVAVSYDPPVRRTRTLQYAGTRMYWRLFRGDVDQEDIYTAMSVEDATEDASVERPKDMDGIYKFSVGQSRRFSKMCALGRFTRIPTVWETIRLRLLPEGTGILLP